MSKQLIDQLILKGFEYSTRILNPYNYQKTQENFNKAFKELEEKREFFLKSKEYLGKEINEFLDDFCRKYALEDLSDRKRIFDFITDERASLETKLMGQWEILNKYHIFYKTNMVVCDTIEEIKLVKFNKIK